MKILAEATWDKDGELVDGEPPTEKALYWLLYFGTDYKIIELEEGRITAVNYTIAVCQHCETGLVECFRPEQLKILGKQIKE